MEFKDRDVLRLNQENDRAMRLQQERIKKQLEEAVAETKSSGSGGSSISPFNIFRMPKNSEGKESLESAICHSVRIPTRCFLKFEVKTQSKYPSPAFRGFWWYGISVFGPFGRLE